MSVQQRFIIIDGNALVHRAFHALPPLSTKEGKLVNAVYGFTTVLLKALKELEPTHLAVTFDLPAPTFRHEMYKEYKATRVKQPQELYDQLPLIKDVVRAFKIPVVELAGYEADDLIATLSKKTEKEMPGAEDIILTGDMDTLQLVDENTKVYGFRKGLSDLIIYDEKMVKERYGLVPKQLVDYKALRGDPSDNIPGVKGVGEKTATELIQKFGSLEKLYKAVEKPSGEVEIKPRILELLKQYKADAVLGRALVELVDQIPLKLKVEDCIIQPPDLVKLKELFENFGFKTLLSRVEKLFDPTHSTTIVGPSAATLPLGGLSTTPPLVVDKNRVCGYDLKKLWRQGLLKKERLDQSLFDIMIAAYLVYSSERDYSLENIAANYHETVGDPKELVTRLVSKLEAELKKQGLWEVFEKIEMPLLPVLAAMESAGIKLDIAYLNGLSKRFAGDLEKLSKQIYDLSGTNFNINSPLQLREVLYEKMKLAPAAGRIKKTTKGRVASTAAGELEKLRGIHPIVDFIFEYRELAKLQSTYTDALVNLINPKDGRVHTIFNQAVTSTGRLSSSNPNLQNIPIRTETGRLIRRAFIAEKGFSLLSADYSQIELRVAASLSGDQKMIDAFKGGEDFHAKTAALVAGVQIAIVTKEMRRAAKAVNFGVLYGMGPDSLARATGFSRAEAENFIFRYFQTFSQLRNYLDGLKDQARDLGFVTTLFGRRRYLPEIRSGMPQVRAAAERMALNMPIQGTAADLIKMAMANIDRGVRSQKLEARMLLQVHDELVFEVKDDLVNEVAPKIKEIMENTYTLRVPLAVEVKAGKNWGELEKLEL